MNLYKHRLNAFYEIEALIAKIGNEKFSKYRDAVFIILNKLKPNEVYNITERVKAANHGVFIKCVCLYMIETGGCCNVMLSNDYTKVIGIQSFNDSKKEFKDYAEQVKQMREKQIA